MLLQTDQATFTLRRLTGHGNSNQACGSMLPPPVHVHGGCHLHQRTQPAQWHESASRGGRRTLRRTSPTQGHICNFSRKQLCVAFKTCGECRARALRYLFRISVLCSPRVVRLLCPIGAYLLLHGRQNLRMRGLGSTDARTRRCTWHWSSHGGRGSRIRADSGDCRTSCARTPCPTYGYEVTRARTSGLRQYLFCALVTARPCVSGFVNN